jgi:hypothetical protein
MDRAHLFIATAAAASMVVTAASGATAAAQQPAAAPAPKVTLTGCVERADQIVDRANLGTSVDSQSFVLIKNDAQPANAAAGTAGAGSIGAPAAQDVRTIYWLRGSHDFNAHVGHQVEIVGRLEHRGPAAVGTSGVNNAPSAQTPSAATPEPMAVDSIKMVSPTCRR